MIKARLVSVSPGCVSAPPLLVYVDSTSGAVVDAGSGLFSADRALHDSLSPLFLPPSPLESVQ